MVSHCELHGSRSQSLEIGGIRCRRVVTRKLMSTLRQIKRECSTSLDPKAHVASRAETEWCSQNGDVTWSHSYFAPYFASYSPACLTCYATKYSTSYLCTILISMSYNSIELLSWLLLKKPLRESRLSYSSDLRSKSKSLALETNALAAQLAFCPKSKNCYRAGPWVRW